MIGGKANIPFSPATKMGFIVCVLTSVFFVLTVSFHDYLPEHPPAYVLLAEDKIKYKYTALKGGGNAGTLGFIDSDAIRELLRADINEYVFLTGIIGNAGQPKFNGFLSGDADLPPPAA